MLSHVGIVFRAWLPMYFGISLCLFDFRPCKVGGECGSFSAVCVHRKHQQNEDAADTGRRNGKHLLSFASLFLGGDGVPSIRFLLFSLLSPFLFCCCFFYLLLRLLLPFRVSFAFLIGRICGRSSTTSSRRLSRVNLFQIAFLFIFPLPLLPLLSCQLCLVH